MDFEKELITTMKIVEEVLRTNDKARNSDKWLIIEVLKKMGFKIFIDYKQLSDMPSFETITRCRRKLQEENPNLQSSYDTEQLREQKREELRNILNKQDIYRTEVFNFKLKPLMTTEVKESDKNAVIFNT
jgi:hypothetical protein